MNQNNTKLPPPKIIFFDIDDTLSRNGVLAEHNKVTLEELAKTDIKVVIATGRPKPMLPADIIALHNSGVIDAIICKNGQYSFYISDNQEHILSHYPLNTNQIKHIIAICEQEEVVYKFDTDRYIAWAQDNYKQIPMIVESDYFIVDPDIYHKNDVYQGTVFFMKKDNRMEHIDFSQYQLKIVQWHEVGADILPIDASKARAVKDVCTHFDVSVSDCMAFGDGYNDIEMFEIVGCPVAMTDGAEMLKEVALKNNGMIADTIENMGIQKVLANAGIV